jgi:thioredoxin-related protein
MPSVLRRWLLLPLLLLPLAAWAEGSSPTLPTADDWQAEAEAARSRSVPLVVVFTDDDCPYCQRLIKQVLAPMFAKPGFANQVSLLEFNISRGGKIRDFDGLPVRSRHFVKRLGVFATPTLLLLDYQGREIAPRIVGINDVEEYRRMLQERITAARAALSPVVMLSVTRPRSLSDSG